MPQFVYFFLVKKYGLESLADMHVTQLQLALVHHRKHKRVKFMGMMVGAYDVDAHPPLKLRDSNFIMQALEWLKKHNRPVQPTIMRRAPKEETASV